MEKEQFNQIKNKLDSILKLLTINILHGKTTKEQTIILADYGFKQAEISKILGKPLANISSYISQHKKKKGVKK